LTKQIKEEKNTKNEGNLKKEKGKEK